MAAKQPKKPAPATDAETTDHDEREPDPEMMRGNDAVRQGRKTTAKSPLDSVQVTDRRIALWFGDRELTVEQAEACRRVRTAAAAFAQTIKSNVVGSPDQTAAIRQVREATDTAISGIKNGNL